MSNLKERFIKHWQDKRFIQPGDTLLLAVSGGSDSMSLANLLLEAGVLFAVAHCNFGLRGNDADGDELFVKEWCDQRNIACFTIRFDTNKEIETTGKGIQEAARDLRYTWFHHLADEHHFAAIATAHHADDSAETMLINLSRGTGIAGLHGIPEHNGKIIRPLLFATRAELNEYVADQHIAYREDASNHKDDYLRNAIRHRVLPVLEELLPGLSKRMLETSKRIEEAEIIYQQGIERERKKLMELRGKDYYLPVKLLRHRKPLAAILYELLKPFGFNTAQLPTAAGLLEAESGKYISSPTHRLIRNRDFLILTAAKEAAADMILMENFGEEIITPSGRFQCSVLTQVPQQLEQAPNIAFINADKLEPPIILRRWKTGDYFYPLGMVMKKKKLSRFLIDQKIPLHEKEQIWVLESNKRIVWVAGLRLDERFKVTSNTTPILKIVFRVT